MYAVAPPATTSTSGLGSKGRRGCEQPAFRPRACTKEGAPGSAASQRVSGVPPGGAVQRAGSLAPLLPTSLQPPAPPPLSQASSTCLKCHTCLYWCPRHQARQPRPWTASPTSPPHPSTILVGILVLTCALSRQGRRLVSPVLGSGVCQQTRKEANLASSVLQQRTADSFRPGCSRRRRGWLLADSRRAQSPR